MLLNTGSSDWTGLDWIAFDLIELDWFGLLRSGLLLIGLDCIAFFKNGVEWFRIELDRLGLK